MAGIRIQIQIIQKRHSEIFLYYQISVSGITRNFWPGLKKVLYIGIRATLNFKALSPKYRLFLELCQKLRLIIQSKLNNFKTFYYAVYE